MQILPTRQATSLFLVFMALVSQMMLGCQSSRLGTGFTDSSQVLSGKSILFFGDSLTAGYGIKDYADTWCGMLASEYGMEVTSRSVNGSTIGAAAITTKQPGGCRDPMCQRALPEGFFDLIFLEGGGNDWYCEIPIGSDPESRDPYTEYGAINVLIDRVQEAYPDALLVFSTSWNSTGTENGIGLTTEDYNQAILKVCSLRGIPCFHANDPEVSGIDASTEASRKGVFLSASDFWHLDADAHKAYLPVIAAWLQAVTLNDYSVCGFYDVSRSDWFAEDVSYVYGHSIMSGTSATEFSPDDTVSRGMFLTMLYRLAGEPSAVYVGFSDVEPDAWYADAACWAYNAQLVDTVSADSTAICPEEPVTRAQLAVMLYRYAALRGYDQIETDDLSRFTDLGKLAAETRSAISWASAAGILRGTSDTTFSPQSSVTRAEAAAILHRFCTH